jgi:hypothetical protein
MNPDATVVFNKSKLAKAIHEEADAGPSGADHFCQSFLCDLRNPAGLTGVHAHSGKRNLTVEDRTARVGITSSIFFLGTLRRALARTSSSGSSKKVLQFNAGPERDRGDVYRLSQIDSSCHLLPGALHLIGRRCHAQRSPRENAQL